MHALFSFFLSIFCFLFSCFPGEAFAQKDISGPVFMVDALNVSELPENYRKEDEGIQGIKNLPIIGSHQFSIWQFLTILKQHPNKNIVVVDLREEPHFFVNGQAVTYYTSKNWANKGLSLPQIHQNEKKLYHFLKSQKHLVAFKEGPQRALIPIPLKVSAVLTEEEFIKSLGIRYLRLYNSDHMAPSPKNVDKFIRFAQSLPTNTTLLLHCRAGEGRTTTFMVIYDMIKNAKTLSFEKILNRQHKMGGVNLLNPTSKGYKSPLEWQRLSFLKKFYEYARTNTDNFQTPWSAYTKRKIQGK